MLGERLLRVGTGCQEVRYRPEADVANRSKLENRFYFLQNNLAGALPVGTGHKQPLTPLASTKKLTKLSAKYLVGREEVRMPKLRSGRYFALEQRSLSAAATSGSDEQMYAFVLTYRLEVTKPSDLVHLLPVLYFKEGEGEPPNAPMYRSGFLVMDVLEGRAGWSQNEIEEMKAWLETNAPLQSWLEKNFTEIDLAIRNSPLWKSALIND